MRGLSESEVAVVSGSLYESVNTGCVLAAAGMVVAIPTGLFGIIGAGPGAVFACLYSNNSSNYYDSKN